MIPADDHDVAVIGAGPGGAMAALLCARQGKSVLLIDKVAFPRDKTCGCCLSQSAIQQLHVAGLADILAKNNARKLHQIQLASGGFKASLRLAPSYVISRSLLDAQLAKTVAQAGGKFIICSATLGPNQDNYRTVLLREPSHDSLSSNDRPTRSIRVKVVIAATGLASAMLDNQPGFESIIDPASRFGASSIFTDAPPFYADDLYMAVAPHGYVGLTRLEDHRLNVAGAFDAGFMRAQGGAANAVISVLTNAGLPVWPGIAEAQWRGTPWLTRRRTRVAGPRLLVIGDAASYVEPFTGEGIGWAMADGVAAAALIAEPWASHAEQQWERYHQTVVLPRQRRCQRIARLLRHPHLSTQTLRVVSRFPRIARLLFPQGLK